MDLGERLFAHLVIKVLKDFAHDHRVEVVVRERHVLAVAGPCALP